jgi:hypothetical protein
MPSPTQRFPAPWSAEVQPNYYVIRDADGQQLAYIYYSNDPDRRAAAKLLTKDEARRIAANIAKLAQQPFPQGAGVVSGLPFSTTKVATALTGDAPLLMPSCILPPSMKTESPARISGQK